MLDWNYKASQRTSFVEDVVEELQRRRIRLLRVHVAGYYYVEEYALKWLEILRSVPKVRAYWYSRS